MITEWLSPWRAIPDPDLARAFEDELAREVTAPHPLAGLAATALGQHAGNDDVVFALGDGRFAEVHLTWAGTAEAPPWRGSRAASRCSQPATAAP